MIKYYATLLMMSGVCCANPLFEGDDSSAYFAQAGEHKQQPVEIWIQVGCFEVLLSAIKNTNKKVSQPHQVKTLPKSH